MYMRVVARLIAQPPPRHPSTHPSIHPPSIHHPSTIHHPTIHPPTIHPPSIHHPPPHHPPTHHPSTMHWHAMHWHAMVRGPMSQSCPVCYYMCLLQRFCGLSLLALKKVRDRARPRGAAVAVHFDLLQAASCNLGLGLATQVQRSSPSVTALPYAPPEL
jgi:hypothetical protein